LFDSWGLECVGEWLWLKVTTGGVPVTSMNSLHKKPFETLLLARRKDSTAHAQFPRQRVVISTPCTIHSRKPCLVELLQPFFRLADSGKDDTQERQVGQVTYAELFGRCVSSPHSFVVGNEAIKFQHSSFFDE
jgi:N(6)-adenine-specific DNA methyltransferase